MSPLANSHSQVIDNDKGGRPTASEESGNPNKAPEAENAGDY